MRTCIKHIDIFAETGWVRGGSLLLEDTRIAGIFPAGAASDEAGADEVIDARGHFAIPGYIDTHVHGGGGHDINDPPISRCRCPRLSRAWIPCAKPCGTTSPARPKS